MTSEIAHERPKNPAILAEILKSVRRLEDEGRQATFNAILSELSSRSVLKFHRTLRKYLDLLIFAKLLVVGYEKTVQPNIREKQLYRVVRDHDQATVEAGEKALLLHGLNWDVPSPTSLTIKIDLQGLARGTISSGRVYASLEDAVVQSLKLQRRRPGKEAELIVFATALLTTQKIDFNYLINRAKEEGVEDKLLAILLQIDKTLASAHPDVEDIQTLYELRKMYYHTRGPLLRSIQAIQQNYKQTIQTDIVSSNEVIEYAGKQLGIRG